jgi:hypothetical protein
MEVRLFFFQNGLNRAQRLNDWNDLNWLRHCLVICQTWPGKKWRVRLLQPMLFEVPGQVFYTETVWNDLNGAPVLSTAKRVEG